MTFSEDIAAQINLMHDQAITEAVTDETAGIQADLEQTQGELAEANSTITALNAQVSAQTEIITQKDTEILGLQGQITVLQTALTECQDNSTPGLRPMPVGASVPAGAPMTLAQKRSLGMTAFRVFFGPGEGLKIDDAQLADLRAGETWIVSYKDDVPEKTVQDFVAAWPSTVILILVWHHEPENDNMVPATFRATTAKHAGYAHRAGTLYALCLMAYTLNPNSGRKFSDWYTPEVDLVLFDAYNVGTDKKIYTEPAKIVDPCAAAASSVGRPWGIAETGTPDLGTVAGQTRAQWAAALVSAADDKGAVVLTWWDQVVKSPTGVTGKDYRLDTATATAMVAATK